MFLLWRVHVLCVRVVWPRGKGRTAAAHVQAQALNSLYPAGTPPLPPGAPRPQVGQELDIEVLRGDNQEHLTATLEPNSS